jgi:malate dehydrogenase (oxaloacetate-decarboxylating)
VQWQGRSIRISQSNNALVFPGIGMGVIASKAKRVSNEMLWAAAKTLAACSPALNDAKAPILPDLSDVKEVSRGIALAVAEQARAQGLARVADEVDLKERIYRSFWEPRYYTYK